MEELNTQSMTVLAALYQAGALAMPTAYEVLTAAGFEVGYPSGDTAPKFERLLSHIVVLPASAKA